MANDFKIVISATDKATATIRQVNEEFAKLTRPFANVGKSFKRFGSELGLDKVGKRLATVGGHARATAGKMASIVTPLAAITSAASIAGVAKMASSWATLGRNVAWGARQVGVSTTQFQKMQQMGKLTGVGAEALTSGIQSLQDTMQSAKYGGNAQAYQIFSALMKGMAQTKEGVPDAIEQLQRLHKAFQENPALRGHPERMRQVTEALGIGQLTPLLMENEQAWEQDQKAIESFYQSSDTAIAQANDFKRSLSLLSLEADGLQQSILDRVVPIFRPLIDELSTWIAKNRELLSQKVAEWAQQVAKWIQGIDWKKVGDAVTNFIKDIGALIDRLGGVKNAIIAVAVVMNANLILSVLNLGRAMAGPLLRAGYAVIKMFWGWSEAATAAGAASTAAGEAGGLSAATAAKGLAGRAGLVGLAAYGGWQIGSQINKHFVEGTAFGDKLGEGITSVMAWAGSKEAKDAINQTAAANAVMHKGDNAARVKATDPALVQQSLDYFQSVGWTKQQAAGLTAQIVSESAFDPKAVGDSGKAYGILQWHPDRQAEFAKWAGHSMQGSTVAEQRAFMNYELTQGKERAAGARLRATTTGSEAGAVASQAYVRPADVMGEASRRSGLANQLLQQNAAPAGPLAGSAAPANGKTIIELRMPDAPAGTKAVVKQQDAHAQVTPRIGYSAVGGLA